MLLLQPVYRDLFWNMKENVSFLWFCRWANHHMRSYRNWIDWINQKTQLDMSHFIISRYFLLFMESETVADVALVKTSYVTSWIAFTIVAGNYCASCVALSKLKTKNYRHPRRLLMSNIAKSWSSSLKVFRWLWLNGGRGDLWSSWRSRMQRLTLHKENYGRRKRAVYKLINGICAQSPMSVIMIEC